jgi:aspartate aminotransferase-like enzyme
MHAALDLIKNETLKVRWERHRLSSNALQKAIEAMGLELFADQEFRLQSVVAIKIPEGMRGDEIRQFMVKQFGVEISGAFGYDIVRIGQMGEQCRSHNLFKTLYAVGISMRYFGAEVDISKAMSVLEKNLSLDPETFVV